MNNKIIRISTVLMSLCLICISVFSANAVVYIVDNGIKYQVLSDDTVSIAGFESDNVVDFVVPRSYDGRSVVSVANFGMQNNANISSVDFMEATELSKLGMFAFYGCSNLKSVIIPTHITNINECVFKNCVSLETIEFYGNNGIVPIESFADCTALKNVRLNAYLTSIQSRAFAGCSTLEYIELSDTITYIAADAFDGDDNLILGVWKDSYAHQYAKDNSIPYILLDGPKTGDVNGDGVVDILDATEIQKYAAESTDFTDEQFELSDINKDGYCDVIDALLVQKSVIGAYELPQNIIRY